MSPDRADQHLCNWALWMSQGSYRHLKVRLMSAEAGRRWGTDDIENMYDSMDAMAARATNAAVSDLPPLPKMAVHAYYLGHPWVQPVMLSPTVSLACELVGAALERKGFV